MKGIRNCIVGLVLVASTAALTGNAFADANCLRFPISASSWNSAGKTGGPCRISSPYAWRELTPGQRTFHHGIDFSCKEGTPIIAPVDGVAYRESFADGGNHVVRMSAPGVDSRLGKPYKVSFLHNSQWAVETGKPVTTGETIAYLGNEGHSTGAHMHLQITEVGSLKAAIDPNSLACAGTWPGAGPMDEAGDVSGAVASSDISSGSIISSGTNPNETPPRAPGGLDEESRSGDLANDIMARAFNVEYVKQLATLSDVSLVRELGYIEALGSRMALLKARGAERRGALRASVLALQARRLRPAIEKQRAKALNSGNSAGTR